MKRTYCEQAALKWHPDKNADNMEEATERFKEISEAHSTLSDANERAWYEYESHDPLSPCPAAAFSLTHRLPHARYDAHREQILRGGTGLDDEDDGVGIDLFKYFTTSCFKGYGDEKGGFYGKSCSMGFIWENGY